MDEGTAILHAESICDLLRISKKWNAPKIAAYLRRFDEKPSTKEAGGDQ